MDIKAIRRIFLLFCFIKILANKCIDFTITLLYNYLVKIGWRIIDMESVNTNVEEVDKKEEKVDEDFLDAIISDNDSYRIYIEQDSEKDGEDQ